MVLRSVGVLSVAKVQGILGVAFGLIIGGFMTLISVIGIAARPGQGGNQTAAVLFGVGAVIFLPIFYGIIGFIGGLIWGALYNVVAGLVGGVEMNFESGSQGGQYA